MVWRGVGIRPGRPSNLSTQLPFSPLSTLTLSLSLSLHSPQTAGAAVPRSLVVARAARSPPLLSLLCDAALASSTCATTTGFVCVVLTELLAEHAPLADAQLAALLPLLQAALGSKAPVEFQVSSSLLPTPPYSLLPGWTPNAPHRL
jgi:hypothetical protein